MNKYKQIYTKISTASQHCLQKQQHSQIMGGSSGGMFMTDRV
jgi:hypothetical protein